MENETSTKTVDGVGGLLLELHALARRKALPVELCYHPDADPDDGNGWVCGVGDRYFNADGSMRGVLEAALGANRG